MSVALVTDSTSQLPPALAERYGVRIVPVTITVDGEAFLEGEELDADAFFARYADGRSPEVSTAAPAPGQFVAAYEAAAAAGAAEVVSIHVGGDVSATLQSARLAVDLAPVPVTVVDTGTASFGVACCVWEAAEALRAGASAAEAAAVAEALAPSIGNVFVVGALDIVRAGGRLAAGAEASEGVPVLSLVGDQVEVVGTAVGVDEATAVMASYSLRDTSAPLRVAVGIADAAGEPLSLALEERLQASDAVVDSVRYRIGPSIGAHTGPGTAGCFFWPATGI